MELIDIRARLLSLRLRNGMNQAELAEALGFKDRQTLSAIENGDRRITPEEMVKAAAVFGVGIDYFTDPLELAGEGQFSWRQSGVKAKDIDAFEERAGRWIATYRYLSKAKGQAINSSLRRVALNERSSYEHAVAEGEAIGLALRLPDPPALFLAEAVEQQLDTLVLYVDAIDGVSGAACQLDQLNAILINRKESPGRRAYDLAHELFHLLTWHTMKPERVEDDKKKGMTPKQKRIEELAENFAAGLLMPQSLIMTLVSEAPIPDAPGKLAMWLSASSKRLGVSAKALGWRLVNLKLLDAERNKPALDAFAKDPAPPPFSKRFVQVLGWGIEEGHLSARKAALTLGLTVDDLAALFSAHQEKAPFAL